MAVRARESSSFQQDLTFSPPSQQLLVVGWEPNFEDEGYPWEETNAINHLSEPDWQLPDSFADDIATLPLK